MTRTRFRRSKLAAVACITVVAGPALVSLSPVEAAGDPPAAVDTEVVVWGDTKAAQILDVPPEVQDASIKQVAALSDKAVALSADGGVQVWGKTAASDIVSDDLPAMATIEDRATPAGISQAGRPVIWANSWHLDEVPADVETVTSLSVSKSLAGGVRPDGTVAVWGGVFGSGTGTVHDEGLAVPEELKDPTTAHVSQVAMGTNTSDGFGIAVKEDGSLVTWGENRNSMLDVPEDLGPVKSVVIGTASTTTNTVFAITADGKLRQWGSGASSYSLPLAEGDKLAQVSANDNGILGLTEDHRLIVGVRDTADGQALAAAAPDLSGRKVLSIASGAHAHVVVTSAPDPLAVVGEAVVTGSQQVNDLSGLTGTPATFNMPSAEVENQWLANGAPIDGATGLTFAPTRTLEGKKISFRSTATAGDDSAVSTSDETGEVYELRPTAAPVVSGVPRVGVTLTRTVAEFNMTPDITINAWMINGKALTGAAASAESYTIKAADVGKSIAFRSKGLKNFVGTDYLISDPIGPVVAEDAETDSMTVSARAGLSGNAKVGRALTGTPATFNGDPDSVSNQWFADGVAIEGETGTDYTPVEADEYKVITFKSTATRGEETAVSTSDPSAPVQPGKVLEVTTEASVSGNAKSGSTLTGTPATFNLEEATVSNRWLADGAPIDGATGNTLELGAAQVDKKISFESTATYDGASVVSTSDETAKVADVDLAKLTDPSISGTAQVTKTLTGTPGTFNAGTVTNQWFANGDAIDGATNTTYTLVEADEDKTITFKSTATRGSDTLSATSASVGPVLPEILPIEITKDSEITGTAQVGIALTGVPAEFDGDGAVTYQWLVGGEPIDGATGTTYTPVASDEGKMIAFRTIATSGDISLPSTSEPKGPVLPAAEDPNEEPGDDDTKDKIKVLPDSTFKVGETVKVDVGEDYVGDDVSAFLFSDPFSLGTFKVAANGQISITIPANAPTGAHRLAVYDANGDLIGWQNVLVQLKDGSFGPGGSVGPDGRLLPNTGAGMPGYAVPMGILLVLGGLALAVPARARKLKGAHRLPA